MNEYTGKICPFCKTEFKPDDEIVLCSSCEMPHHKDCWVENQGCTTFGCLGTINSPDRENTSVTAEQMKYDDETVEPQPEFVYCTKCGARSSSSAAFCSKCGNRLTTAAGRSAASRTPSAGSTAAPQENSASAGSASYGAQTGYGNYQGSRSGVTDEELEKLVGVKSEYYMPRFRSLKSGNKYSSWNWCAFLFTPYWLIYRKMYAYGAAVLAAAFILSLIGVSVSIWLGLACYIAAGIFANYIYMQYLEGKAIQAGSMNEPYKTQFIEANGGVNKKATVLTVIGYALLTLIFNL